MDIISLDAAPYKVRANLSTSHAEAWGWIAAPGTWLTGAERIAVAAEVRQAHDCALCRDRKEALSPFAIDGRHDGRHQLAENEIEAIHRLATDPGRLRRQWLEDLFAAGLGEGAYVEIAALVAMTMMMDSFSRALGVPETPLPAPVGGEPTKYQPPGAKKRRSLGRTSGARRCRGIRRSRLPGAARRLCPTGTFVSPRCQTGLLVACREPLSAGTGDPKLGVHLPGDFAASNRDHRGTGLGAPYVFLLSHRTHPHAP